MSASSMSRATGALVGAGKSRLSCITATGIRTDNRLENLKGLTTACHLRIHDRLRGQPNAQRWRELVRELRR